MHGHVSSGWTCPTFLRKCTEHDARNPKNSLTEPWTWEATPLSRQRTVVSVELADYIHLNRTGKIK